MAGKTGELAPRRRGDTMTALSWSFGTARVATGLGPVTIPAPRPAKVVAEDRVLTHSFVVSEAYAGMMVTPSVKLARPLGEGGMGSVWVADHLALRTQVVVKFIASDLKDSKEATERFSREAAAAAQVKSPHVVQTFDHGFTTAGVPYIVMELLEGRDLGAFLEAEGRCPPELVVEVITQLARALDRAHERGIIHRDIKPGNIFLCDGGQGEVFVKLLDFGIAKGVDVPKIDSATKTGSMIGSPFYMSPEQILGSRDLDHRSDLWSLGVVAYEALTGQKPFDAETMGGLAIRIHSGPLPLPSSADGDLPPAVDAWFERACARPVTDRFESGKQMADALALALTGIVPSSARGASAASHLVHGVLATSPTLARGAATDAGIVRTTRDAKTRNRVVALAGFGLVLCLGTFGLVSLFRPAKEDPRGLVAEPKAAPLDVHSVQANLGAAAPERSAVATPADSVTAAAPTTNAPAEASAPSPPTVKASGRGLHHAAHRPASTPPPQLKASSPSSSPSPLPAAPASVPTGHDIF